MKMTGWLNVKEETSNIWHRADEEKSLSSHSS